ncbi:hypothetical protein [Bradyrhizobium japonicum]|uniref:hypothetical protein n=1 Tax=Bradyrhizobium japonicum TaxID=375 RepID=UPI00271450D1|nr:hypothetical protein [Bradyrhizobium japonicum]WLB58840.1 hypothetical protein QIH94_23605 [Bradyrhizobium japonicum]WLB59359.1 hypothetical protein QIH96_22725 [Bradyrhizobium japonicum]
MAAVFAELLFDLVRSLAGQWLRQAAVAVCAWLDTKVHGRAARLVVGGLLGLAAYFLIPVFAGLLGF